MAVKTIQVARIQTRLEADGKQHTSAYQKAEREADHYVDHLKKKGKEAAKAFDGAKAGASFGKDFGVSAIAALGQSFNVATLGSLIGTAVAPGIGTAVGSMVGSGIDKALSTVTPMVLNTIMSGVELNKLIEETRFEFKTLVGSEQEANKYLKELLQISEDIGVLPQTVIETSERLSDLTGDLQLTRKILKAASDQAADFGGGDVTFNKIADALGLIAEKGELGSRELQKLYRVGINAKKILAEATGLQEKQIDQLMKQGRLRGDVAARLIAEGIEREKGGFAALTTGQTIAGRERQVAVRTQLRAAEGTQKMTEGYGDFLREANAILGSSQAKGFVEMIDKFSGQIIDWTKTGIKAGVSVGAGFAQGLMDGSSLSSLMGSFTKLKDWAGGALSSVFEIKSPSQWSAREVGEPLGEGIGIGLVRRFSGFMQGEGVEDLKRTLLSLLESPPVRALLDTIATAEGGEMNIMAGGRRVNSGTKHPGAVVPKSQWFKGNRGPSSASGPYQITLTNWRNAEKIFGPLDFSNPEHHKLVALWLMSSRTGGLDTLRGGNVGQMMNLAAQDWTSTPGSTIGGGKQWSRGKWLNTYQSSLGNGWGGSLTGNWGQPKWGGELAGKFGGATPVYVVNYGGELTGSFGDSVDPVTGLKNVGEAIVNITDSSRELVTTSRDFMTDIAMVPMRTLSPVLQAEYEIAKARTEHASTAIGITKSYQEASREALIISEGVLGRFAGMLGQVAGMVPGQQVGKKRGLFSKILGFAAPFLSFIPGVGPLLSTLAGMGSNAAAGNWAGVVTGAAGALGTPWRQGGFRGTPNTTPKTLPGRAGKAHGGPVYRGTPYIVGERRAEVFEPTQDGRIYPSVDEYARTRGGGGGNDIWDRLIRLLERMESMKPDDVVRFGADGLNRALDGNAKLGENLGRRLNLARG